MPAGELFLSHATPDRAFVERLTKRLAARKIRFFYSKRHIAGARQWRDELGAALNRCTWFVLILSKKSVRSEWVKRELLFALQSPRYRARILPVLLADCAVETLSWTLPSFQFVDFRADFEAGFAELTSALAKPARRAGRAGKGRSKKATKKKSKRA